MIQKRGWSQTDELKHAVEMNALETCCRPFLRVSFMFVGLKDLVPRLHRESAGLGKSLPSTRLSSREDWHAGKGRIVARRDPVGVP